MSEQQGNFTHYGLTKHYSTFMAQVKSPYTPLSITNKTPASGVLWKNYSVKMADLSNQLGRILCPLS